MRVEVVGENHNKSSEHFPLSFWLREERRLGLGLEACWKSYRMF